MPRGRWKGLFLDHHVIRSFQRTLDTGPPRTQKIPITLFSRRSIILPEMNGYRFNIHTGNDHQEMEITKEMIGKKFGEFAWSKNVDIVDEDSIDTAGEGGGDVEELTAPVKK